MQVSNFTRTETGNIILFKNTSPFQGITALKYYTDNSSGSFQKKEFRWSFNGDYWSSWTTLNQGNISSTSLGNNPYLFLEIRYTSAGGTVTSFILNYDGAAQSSSTSECPTDSTYTSIDKSVSDEAYLASNKCAPDSGPLDAATLCGKPCDYYLWRPNHKGQQPISSITDLQKILNNLSGGLQNTITGGQNVEGSGVGVFYDKVGQDLYFKTLDVSGGGLEIAEQDGVIYFTVDASFSIDDASINELYNFYYSLESDLQDLSVYVDTQFSSIDSSILRIDSSITDLYSKLGGDSSIYGLQNIGGEASIYSDTVLGIARLRSLRGAGGISVYVDGDTVVIDGSISGGDSSIRGVENIGAGSGEVFSSIDPSGNIELRTIDGSGAALVTQVGDTIVIGLDASFAGEVNYGVNVGSGDASIYYQKVGDALQFRTLKAGPNITLDVSGQIVEIGATGSSGDGIDGGVWITDINPQSSGNVGDKSYSSDGNVLDSCLTDTSALAVSVLALPGHTNYKPAVEIEGNPVSLSANPDKPLWTGTYNIQYNFADASITVHHEDGASWSTIVDADTPAVIQSADFVNGYPGTQTELKAGDTYDVRVQTDVAISSVIVDDYEAATGGTYSPPSPTNDFTFIITIADRGNTTVARGLRLRVVKPTGSTSANYLTENQGSVDGKDLVNLNNTYPEISFTSIDYPVGQQAIKSSESAIVNHTVTDYNTINYTSPGGQLNITNSTIYEPAKNVDYSSGGYNINTDNFSISANRAANNAASSYSTVVWIANTPATLSVSHASKMRSGGNDGTSVQNHQIAINSDQRLLSAPDLIKDTGGTWAGTGFSWSPTATTFTRNLAVHDDESKTTYNWGSITGTNLAGIVTSTNSGTTQYVFSGFVVRTITVQPLLAGKANTINVEVTDYTKLSSSGSGQTLTWTVKDLTIRSGLGDTADGQAETWSASGTGSNPTTIYILDTNALNSSSQASTFTIQEGV
jgi:hypothetical protein